MTVYKPTTMIGRAALAAWQQIGKEETPLQDVVRIVQALRTPDMDVMCAVAAALQIAPRTVSLIWCQTIDAVLAQRSREEANLAAFSSATAFAQTNQE